MRVDITKEQLKDFLLQAQKVHHEYESNMEGSDSDWAGWYAEFIYSRFEEMSGAEGADASS